MEPKLPQNITQKSLNFQTPFSTRSLHPDLDDPNSTSINTSATKKIPEKPLPHELRSSRDNTRNSFQSSTQHSLNLKHSFSIPGSISAKDLSEAYAYNNSESSSLKSTLKSDLKQVLRESGEEGKPSKPGFENVEASLEEKKKERVQRERLWKSEDFREESIGEEMTVFEGDLQIPHLKWCANCKAEVMTKVEYVNNSKTFWSAVGIFLIGGVCGCFLLPYMSKSCKGIRVLCSKCDRVLI